jgi:uncharacterized protein YceH (UPF0502 family)
MPLITLTPTECRCLGVLVEKAQTVPGQYPLTLNALNVGCNQKNNRDPVTNLSEDDVLTAMGGLRNKGLAREAMLAGSRVHKYRHVAREALEISTPELIVLTELLLRGPQAVGELRGRAVRMSPAGDASLATLEGAQAILDGLAARPEPMVKRLPRRPGERAERWVQLLCPDLHPLDGAVSGDNATEEHERVGDRASLAQRVEALEGEVASLRNSISRLAQSAGLPDPLE